MVDSTENSFWWMPANCIQYVMMVDDCGPKLWKCHIYCLQHSESDPILGGLMQIDAVVWTTSPDPKKSLAMPRDCPGANQNMQ